jgi:hypothetical protein
MFICCYIIFFKVEVEIEISVDNNTNWNYMLHNSICCKAVQPQRIGSPNLHNRNALQLCCSLPQANTEDMYWVSAHAAKQYNRSALAALIYIIETYCNCAAPYHKPIQKTRTAYQHMLESSTTTAHWQP